MEDIPTTHWVSRCSERLQQQWPTIEPTRLDDLAIDISLDPKLRALEPKRAAIEWLRQGVPVSAGGRAC